MFGGEFDLQTKTAAVPTNNSDPTLQGWQRRNLSDLLGSFRADLRVGGSRIPRLHRPSLAIPLTPHHRCATAFQGPSTLPVPWLSERGTWLAMAQNKTRGCQLWESTDCFTWRVINDDFGLCPGNSPNLFPLPRTCHGCELLGVEQGPPYTHTMTYCAGEVDAYVFGNYTSGPRPSFAPLTPQQTFEVGKVSQFEDGRGAWAEVMWDPTLQRNLTMRCA